jgi:hypothetical protein
MRQTKESKKSGAKTAPIVHVAADNFSLPIISAKNNVCTLQPIHRLMHSGFNVRRRTYGSQYNIQYDEAWLAAGMSSVRKGTAVVLIQLRCHSLIVFMKLVMMKLVLMNDEESAHTSESCDA